MDYHICDGVCGKEYPRTYWTADILKKHRTGKTQKMLCKECTEKGCSTKDVKLYHCVGCDQHLGHARFDKHSLYNKEHTKRSEAELVCLECQRQIPCDACKKRYAKRDGLVHMLKERNDEK